MAIPGFSPRDFGHILRVCYLAPLSDGWPPADLRRFLVARLRGDLPDLAQRIARLDEAQLAEVCRQVEQTLEAGVGSFL